MTVIEIEFGELDYKKYQEIITWCKTCVMGECRFEDYSNPFQFEGMLAAYKHEPFKISFNFEKKEDAAMFKLSWWDANDNIK